jgi:hypothetical protein
LASLRNFAMGWREMVSKRFMLISMRLMHKSLRS